MRFSILAGVLIGLLMGALAPVDATDVASRAQAIRALQSSVVLTRIEQGQGGRGFCGGTIVGPDLVLTAFHCVRTTINDKSENKTLGIREYMDQGRVKAARVIKYKSGVDLALLRTEESLRGRIAKLPNELGVGDEIMVVGAPQTLRFDGSFVLTQGIVSQIRTMAFLNCDGSREAFGSDVHQVILADVHVYFGNSGGGAFNQAGELVGVLVRGESAESDDYRTCNDEPSYQGEDLLWAYLVGPKELYEVMR